VLADPLTLGGVESPIRREGNSSVICRIKETGVTILAVEQNVKQTLAIAAHGQVMSRGKVVPAGDIAALRENAEVRAA